MLTKAEIQAEVAAAKGMPWKEKTQRYNQAAQAWVRSGYPEDVFAAFSDGIFQVATNRYKWETQPPVWLHGGPAGLEPGDELRAWPHVPSPRKPAFATTIARSGLVSPRPHYVYFTHSRTMALVYSAQHRKGQIYRVQPEGKIQADPQAFCLLGMLQEDPEIDMPFEALVLACLDLLPCWRTPSARILGIA